MKTKRDLAGMGTRLLKRKVPQADAVREVGVSRQAVRVSLWAKQLAAVNGAVGHLRVRLLGRPKRFESGPLRLIRSIWPSCPRMRRNCAL